MWLSTARVLAITAVHALRYGVRRGLLVPGADAGRLQRLQGSCLAAWLEQLGPTYVKLGQLLSARPDIVARPLAAELARLQDHVRPVRGTVALRALRDGLGREPGELFSFVDPAPLASGSIAQVHRATARDGRELALKIRRPGVVRRLEADLRLLLDVARLVEQRVLHFPIVAWLGQFADAVRGQLDLAREAHSYSALRANLTTIPDLRIPAVHRDLTTDRVLVMEYLGGLHRVDDHALPIADRRRALRAGLAALYQMIFVDGFIHADLHPGNIFFRMGGECVLLDAGVAVQLDDAVRVDFIDFFHGLATDRGDDCARIIYDRALYRSPLADRRAFDAEVRATVSRFSQLPASQFEVASFAAALFDIQHRHQIYGAPDFMMAIVALLTFEGIVKRVEPELEFQAIARDMLPAARRSIPAEL